MLRVSVVRPIVKQGVTGFSTGLELTLIWSIRIIVSYMWEIPEQARNDSIYL